MNLTNRPSKQWYSLAKKVSGGLAFILAAIYYLDQDYPILVRWDIIKRIILVSGGIMLPISHFDAILILSVIVLLIIVTTIILYLTSRMEWRIFKARQETKQWKEEANKPKPVPDDYDRKVQEIQKAHAEELDKAKEEIAGALEEKSRALEKAEKDLEVKSEKLLNCQRIGQDLQKAKSQNASNEKIISCFFIALNRLLSYSQGGEDLQYPGYTKIHMEMPNSEKLNSTIKNLSDRRSDVAVHYLELAKKEIESKNSEST